MHQAHRNQINIPQSHFYSSLPQVCSWIPHCLQAVAQVLGGFQITHFLNLRWRFLPNKPSSVALLLCLPPKMLCASRLSVHVLPQASASWAELPAADWNWGPATISGSATASLQTGDLQEATSLSRSPFFCLKLLDWMILTFLFVCF